MISNYISFQITINAVFSFVKVFYMIFLPHPRHSVSISGFTLLLIEYGIELLIQFH